MPQRTQPRFRPSDLLPWADPHIRSLVEQLQQEVREETAQRREASTEQPTAAPAPVRQEARLSPYGGLPTGARF